ncbi:MAG TPA: hypothetical protein PLD27_11270 [bacterium]|nr:hypothetical protein [bacterium]HOL48703.1 hypothetical protein [bacterium]HPQ19818.1 hypothetical protein [bacterium]
MYYDSSHNLEFVAYLYIVANNYIAVCPKLDIFVFSNNKNETLKQLSQKILYFFTIKNVEIIDCFKNNVLSKYKLKFITSN